jgi:hypothetical protein
VQKNGGHLPRSEQHLGNAEALGKLRQSRLTGEEGFREESFERVEQSMHGVNPSADPTQRSAQLNVQAQPATGRLQTRCLLDSAHHRFDLGQGAREAGRQTVRQ